MLTRIIVDLGDQRHCNLQVPVKATTTDHESDQTHPHPEDPQSEQETTYKIIYKLVTNWSRLDIKESHY